MNRVHPAWLDAFFLLMCAGILTWKLLLPGFIGMASNGDFGKIIGPLCMDGVDHSADNFIFFQADYVRGQQYCFPAPYFSSETALAWIASSVERIFRDPVHFDIRWLGVIHTLLFLGFYSALLLLLRRFSTGQRIIASLVALWIFADIGTIAYLNSFFTDTPAMLGALTAVVLALHLAVNDEPRLPTLALFGLAALLFVGSKAQHGLLSVVPVVFLCWLVWRARTLHHRLAIAVVALIVLGTSVWMVLGTPRSYIAQARFNLIFFYTLPHSNAPGHDLTELGLGPGDARYSGLTAFSKTTPLNEEAWRNAFVARTSYARVLRFDLRHPFRALAKLDSDLRNEAPRRRVVYLSNYRRECGKPPGARDPQLGSWSALRALLFRLWPPHIIAWLALACCAAPLLARRLSLPFGKALAWAISITALLAIAEFFSVSLADAIETDRHLMLFHVFTDLTIFLAVLLGLGWEAETLGRTPGSLMRLWFLQSYAGARKSRLARSRQASHAD
jgi:hypothetical protein